MRIFALLVFFFAVSVGSSSSFATEVTKYYVSDKLSQSSLVFDGSGNLVGQERLKSFGEVDVSNRASEEWHHSYHGKQRHTSHGLIDFGARFYDPELGRFLTIDPRGFRESSPDSFNRYAFANNNPYRYTDPDGRVVETAWDFANIGIGAHSLANNIASKNWGAAAVDTVGLGLDALAAAVPFVPGGASAAIKAERAVGSTVSNPARANASAPADRSRLPGGSKSSDDFFEGTQYTNKVKEQIKQDDFHSFPESVLGFQGAGKVSKLKGGDGVVRDKLEIPGSYRGRDGNFEFIKEPDNTINHRLFRPNKE